MKKRIRVACNRINTKARIISIDSLSMIINRGGIPRKTELLGLSIAGVLIIYQDSTLGLSSKCKTRISRKLKPLIIILRAQVFAQGVWAVSIRNFNVKNAWLKTIKEFKWTRELHSSKVLNTEECQLQVKVSWATPKPCQGDNTEHKISIMPRDSSIRNINRGNPHIIINNRRMKMMSSSKGKEIIINAEGAKTIPFISKMINFARIRLVRVMLRRNIKLKNPRKRCLDLPRNQGLQRLVPLAPDWESNVWHVINRSIRQIQLMASAILATKKVELCKVQGAQILRKSQRVRENQILKILLEALESSRAPNVNIKIGRLRNNARIHNASIYIDDRYK